MSTRSYIAQQTAENAFKAIYCHTDGMPSRVGQTLQTYYNSPDRVAALIQLGNLSVLGPYLVPNPNKPHTFDNRQPDVTVAYHRDRGDTDEMAYGCDFEWLTSDGDIEWIYIYTLEQKWVVTRPFCTADKVHLLADILN